MHLQQLKQATYSSGRETAEYLNAARQWLKGHNILLHRRKGQGIFIDGNRHWIRLAQWSLYQELCGVNGTPMDNESVCGFFGIPHNYNLKAIPDRLEQKYGLWFSAESYARILFLLTAVLMDQRRKATYHFPMEGLSGSQMERNMTQDCVEWMREMCGICLEAEEQTFLIFLFASSEILEFSNDRQWVEFAREHKQLLDLTHSMASVVGSVLQADIGSDPVLIQGWMQYIHAMYTESHYGVLRSRRGAEVSPGNGKICLACWSVSHLLEEKLEMLITEREVACLAQHVEAAVERISHQVSAVLVSDRTPGSTRLLEVKLCKKFPSLTIVGICHSYHADEFIRNRSVELVISTEEVPELAKKTLVVISPALTAEDVAAIRERIQKYFREEVPSLAALPPAQPLFREDLVLFLSGNETKNEILQQMVAALSACGAVNEVFLRSVLGREATSSTYLEQGIAIPHGFAEFVEQPMVAVAFLEKPVRWSGSDWVDVIFLLAVSMEHRFKAQKRIICFYRGLIQTLSQPEQIQRFKRLTTPKDVVDAIHNMMNPNTSFRKE